jgi:capsular polysaccharide biosynthesis protein
MHNKIYDVFLKNYPTEVANPEKMVYVSRRNASIDRIDDERKIESFFESLGFEIFFRGNFGEQNLIEDIKYFRDVRVIAGLSGAGLTNSIFMPPGGLVIEISVPQITHVPEEHDLFPEIRCTARHLFHPASSFIKDHTHIQISVNDNSADTAINKIKRLGIFR